MNKYSWFFVKPSWVALGEINGTPAFVALETAAAVAPEVAGPTTALTFDWVTKLVVTEAASAVSDLLSLSTTSSFFPSIPPALLISSTASWAPFCSAVP